MHEEKRIGSKVSTDIDAVRSAGESVGGSTTANGHLAYLPISPWGPARDNLPSDYEYVTDWYQPPVKERKQI